MKKILVTGSSGFIGRKFLSLYNNEFDLIGLDTNYYLGSQDFDQKINFIKKDIRNINSSDLKGVDVIVHMAELCNDPLSELNPRLTYDINVNATQKLLEIAKDSVKKFIYMSSCSVYGKSSNQFVDENSNVEGLTEYSKAKINNENFILNNNFDDMEIIILRNATVFGSSENIRLDLVVNNLIYFGLINGRIELQSDGTPLRPLIHVQDVCGIIKTIIRSDKKFDKEIFNNGSTLMNYSVKEIANKVADSLGIDLILPNKKDSDQRSYRVNFDKLEKFFHYEFVHDLVSGIEEIKSFIDNNNEFNYGFRLQVINNLIKEKKLDKDLYWV